MAVFRESPKCFKCGEPIRAIFDDQKDIPMMARLIGDTFIKWDYEGHNVMCKGTFNLLPMPDESEEFKKFQQNIGLNTLKDWLDKIKSDEKAKAEEQSKINDQGGTSENLS
jgi:hypothetical protein